MKEKIAIIIPAVNCLEYSKKTIESIKTEHEYEIIFINNGSTDGTLEWLQTQKTIITYNNPIVNGLAEIWNMGIKRAIRDGCSLFLILNNDIVLAPTTIDNLVKKFRKGKYIMVTGVNHHEGMEPPEKIMETSFPYDENELDREHPDFSCFLIDKNTIDKIGFFDENYRIAYFEDSDYHARIALAGEKAISTTSAAYYHHASKTVQENEHLKNIVHQAFEYNKNYFIKKWGHENVGDVPEMLKVYFKTPFNNPNKTIKNIEFEFSL